MLHFKMATFSLVKIGEKGCDLGQIANIVGIIQFSKSLLYMPRNYVVGIWV